MTSTIGNRIGAVSAAALLGVAALTVPAIAQDADDDATTDQDGTDQGSIDQDGDTEADEQLDDSREARREARAERREAGEASREARAEGREAREAVFVERLADELGLEVDDVEAAVTSVRDEMVEEARADRLAELETRLDERVADGDLTQEEADEILAAAEDGELPDRGRRGHGGPRGFDGFGSDEGAPADETAADETSA